MVVGDDVAFFLDDEPTAAGLVFHLAALRVIHPDDLDADKRRFHARDGLFDRRAEWIGIVAVNAASGRSRTARANFSMDVLETHSPHGVSGNRQTHAVGGGHRLAGGRRVSAYFLRPCRPSSRAATFGDVLRVAGQFGFFANAFAEVKADVEQIRRIQAFFLFEPVEQFESFSSANNVWKPR